MKRNTLFLLLTVILLSACSKSVKFSPEFKAQTTGRYLYHDNDVIDVFYKDNTIYFNWREGVIEPVVMDSNEFFVSDLYAKLRFVKHPETEVFYLSEISKDNEDLITYDFIKVADDYKTPRMHLKDKEYKQAVEGFLAIKKKDSTKDVVNEGEINQLGYRLINDKKYDDAIEVLKMNVTMFPESSNVYDSLGEAYLSAGDSAQAYKNYKIAFEMNPRNTRAQNIAETLIKYQDSLKTKD